MMHSTWKQRIFSAPALRSTRVGVHGTHCILKCTARDACTLQSESFPPRHVFLCA